MTRFLQNLGFGSRPVAGYDPYDPAFGATGPGGSYETAVGGLDPMDPQLGAVGLMDGDTYSPEKGARRKKGKKDLKPALAGVGGLLAQGPDVTQGMPAAQPFRLVRGAR